MDALILSDREKEFVHMLAKMRQSGKRSLVQPKKDLAENGFEVDGEELIHLLATMESIGVLERRFVGTDFVFPIIEIHPQAITISRSIDATDKEEDDIVEQVKKSARKNRITAPLLILFFVATLAVTFANQLVSFLQNMGWMAKP